MNDHSVTIILTNPVIKWTSFYTKAFSETISHYLEGGWDDEMYKTFIESMTVQWSFYI